MIKITIMCRDLHSCTQDRMGLNADYSTMCVDVFKSLFTKENSNDTDKTVPVPSL